MNKKNTDNSTAAWFFYKATIVSDHLDIFIHTTSYPCIRNLYSVPLKYVLHAEVQHVV
jgi:hypothetical protein